MPQPGRQQPGVVHLTTVHQTWDNRIFNKECRALAEAGLAPTLVTGAEGDQFAGGVQVVALHRRSRVQRLVLSQLEAWKALGRLRPAVVHVHDPELVPLALAWRRSHRGVRAVYDAHEDLVAQISTKPYLNAAGKVAARALAKLLVGLADRGMDAIVAATEPVAAGYRHNRRVVVVRNVPWLRDFTTAPAPVARRAVYTGDLTEERGLPRMLGVMNRIPDAELVLAGRALRGCAKTVEELPEGGPVRHVGLLAPAEVPALISTAQVGLIFLKRLPNYAESLPTKVFEYMAAGVPFLATDFPAWERLFGGSDAGVFVDTDDEQATAAALQALLDDPEGCRRMGQNGRRLIEQEFSFEVEAPKLVALTRELLAEAASDAGPAGTVPAATTNPSGDAVTAPRTTDPEELR